VQEFITTTSLSCSAGSQRPPSGAANRNPLRRVRPRLDGMVHRECGALGTLAFGVGP
jgi:hypothetical protein